jgi:hypothetical protein
MEKPGGFLKAGGPGEAQGSRWSSTGGREGFDRLKFGLPRADYPIY